MLLPPLRPGFLSLGATDAWTSSFLALRAVLCVVGCSAASLARSTSLHTGTTRNVSGHGQMCRRRQNSSRLKTKGSGSHQPSTQLVQQLPNGPVPHPNVSGGPPALSHVTFRLCSDPGVGPCCVKFQVPSSRCAQKELSDLQLLPLSAHLSSPTSPYTPAS